MQHRQGGKTWLAIEIVDPGQPHAPQARLGRLDRLDDLAEGWFRDSLGYKRHCRFKQDASQRCVFVVLEAAAIWIWGLGGNTSQVKGGRIRPGCMEGFGR